MIRILLIASFLFPMILPAQTVEELNRNLEQAGSAKERMAVHFQLAEAWMRAGDREKAVEHAKSAHQTAIEQGNNGFAARSAFLIGDAYERLRNDRNAEVWFKTCLNFAKAAGDSDLIIQSVKRRSKIATKDSNYRRAYDINQEAFDYFSNKGTSISDLEGKYETQKVVIDREKRALIEEKNRLEREISALSNERDQLSTDKNQLESRQQTLVQEKAKVEEQITEKEQALVTIEEEKRKVEDIAKRKERELENLTLAQLKQKASLDAAKSELAEQKLIAEQEKSLRQQQKAQTRLVIIAGGLGILLFLTLYISGRRSKIKLQRKNKLIEQARERSDELLFNILPKSIGEELKEYGSARARKFDQATVLFTDFKNFTKISEKLSPEELVEEIDRCFKAFDFIIAQYPNIEKIKTIGDAYMCACGLNDGSSMPDNLIRAALDMQEFLQEQRTDRIRQGKPFFEARIGLHTGPVVAGVVGVIKFAYDIWGDTVNIASRMESNCEEGRINISETTYNLVCYSFECTYRGKLEAKNKGAIDMYYVERERTNAFA